MQSLNIDQLIINGSAPLSYASEHVVYHILDIKTLKESSIDDSSKLFSYPFTSHLFKGDVSMPFGEFSQRSLSSNNMSQTILAHTSFLNKNLTILLRSALISGTASFRRALLDFKMTHQRIFAHELNQSDKHQNTLLWYLTLAGLYSSIQELYQLTLAELNINVKNGPWSQTILHYAVVNGNTEEIRIVLDIGVDTNLNDRYGRTALHYIALYGTKDKNDVEITKLLIDYGTLPKYEFLRYKNFPGESVRAGSGGGVFALMVVSSCNRENPAIGYDHHIPARNENFLVGSYLKSTESESGIIVLG
jgi:hypothetical protein